jgi:outer membrane protein assembly factor BamB
MRLLRPSVAFLALASLALAASSDWPGWRGPTADGHAAPAQDVPARWSETENVLWCAPVRGRGHSSPTVVGNRIFLTTADAATQDQLVLAFHRATGKPAWETVVHHGNLDTAGNRNTSQASSSVAWDGERLIVNFLNHHAIFTSALSPEGKVLWQTRVADFVTHQGFGSSPVVHDALVLVTADHRGGGKVSGLDRKTGRIVWQQDRPKIANYASLAVVTAAGRPQAVLAGCNLVVSYDPLTGRKLWEIEASTEETVVTPVTDGARIFVGGGYPKNHVAAIAADGSGKIAWQNGTRAYVPSLIVRDRHVFAVLDAGHAVCWKSDTGEELWRQKVDRDFYASPVMVGNRVFVTSLRGLTSVFDATPEKFTLVAQNQLGDEAYASPSICGNRIYLRAARKGEPRQEFLWCVGK